MLIKEAYALGAEHALEKFAARVTAPRPPRAPRAAAPAAGAAAPAAGAAAPAAGAAAPAAGAAAPAPQGLWNQTKALGGRAMQGWENFSAQNPATAGLAGQLGTTAAMMAIPMMMSRGDR